MENVICKSCGAGNKTNQKYCSSCGYALPIPEAEILDIQVQNPVPAKTDRWKKLLISMVGAIAFGLSYWAVQYFFFSPPSFDKVMMQSASELNKTCPVMVDQYTRLDNAIALPGNTLQYNYTLVDILKGEVNTDTVKKYVEPGIINNVKTNPEMKIYRDNKTTFIYYYKDKNGEFVLKFSVTPDRYQ